MRVLLVEEDQDLRDVTAGMLVELGHEAIEATSVSEAMAITQKVPLEVLIVDVCLTDRACEVVAAEVGRVLQAVRVIFATGKWMPQLAGDRRSPVMLKKPFDVVRLASAVKIARSSI